MTMTTTILDWLSRQFHAARDVRTIKIHPDNHAFTGTSPADMVVRTWMGAQLYVYVLQSEPRLRDLRAILKNNSRDSLGTLFFVLDDLLPQNDTERRLLDWQDALQLLNGGYIYSLLLEDGELHPSQVHFTPTMTPNVYHTWYTPDFTIETVTVRRRTVENVIKGTWHIGDIASADFQRKVNHERVNQRFHYRTQYTRPTDRPAPNSGKMPDTLKRQYKLLGLPQDADEGTVKAAFRRQAMNVHPDVSALPRIEAEKRMKALLEAYESIKQYHNWR